MGALRDRILQGLWEPRGKVMIFLSSVILRIIFLSFRSLSLLDVFPYKPDIFKKQEWAAPRMSFKSIQLEIVSLVEQKQNFEAKKKEKKKKTFKDWNHFYDGKALKDYLYLFIIISQFMRHFYDR